ncbi:MAG: GNAT family N-acetyltransferase [Chloroflexota bacterium]
MTDPPTDRRAVEASGDRAASAHAAGPVEPIRTARLSLVSMSPVFMRALRARDFGTAEREIGASVPRDMADDLAHFIAFRLAQLEVDPTILEWLGRAMVLTDDAGTHRVIGSIGFHGPPDELGRLEVGYRVEAEYRRQGYAMESVQALFDWASERHAVTRFLASISPGNVASRALTAKLGFREIGSQMDEIDGLELIFEVPWPPP